MSGEVPADVQDVLAQLHAAAVGAVGTQSDAPARHDPAPESDRRDDADDPASPDDTVSPGELPGGDEAAGTPASDGDTTPATEFTAAIETAETVARNKLPTGPLRDRLVHGYDRALATVEEEPAVAAEYVRAADRRLAAATDGDPTVDSPARDGDDGEASRDDADADDPDGDGSNDDREDM
ncbi:hypothetical protein [Halobaculum sp. MBLA0143]|uniref:hypothetical protein n=1 Tax=Halobaculum sp. MBLA0143 TaxID=3079933 RepID=UPI003523A15C